MLVKNMIAIGAEFYSASTDIIRDGVSLSNNYRF